MTDAARLKVFLVDDEALALKRLSRLLLETGLVEIAGQETDPAAALAKLSAGALRENIDALFLDIQMPELNGFDLLAKLNWQPFVVFTTAYDEYALRAFAVNSIDYLLKPIEVSPLERARLADLMIESLDAAPLTEVDQAWIDLALRRAEEIRAGTAQTYSAEEVLSEARGSIVW